MASVWRQKEARPQNHKEKERRLGFLVIAKVLKPSGTAADTGTSLQLYQLLVHLHKQRRVHGLGYIRKLMWVCSQIVDFHKILQEKSRMCSDGQEAESPNGNPATEGRTSTHSLTEKPTSIHTVSFLQGGPNCLHTWKKTPSTWQNQPGRIIPLNFLKSP